MTVNSRFLAYCRSQGTPDPEAMLVIDRTRYPGGVMCGFILWTRARWADWRTARGMPQDRASCPAPITTNEDHVDFDAWLAREVS